jgi:hypothetical protein
MKFSRYVIAFLLFSGLVSPILEGASISIDTNAGMRKGVLRQELRGHIRQVPVVLKGTIPASTQINGVAFPLGLIASGVVGANACPGILLAQVGISLGLGGIYAAISQFALTHLTIRAESEDGESVNLKLGRLGAPLLAPFLKRFLREGNPLWEHLPPLVLRIDSGGRVIGMSINYLSWMERNGEIVPDFLVEEGAEELDATSSLLDTSPVVRFSSVLDLAIRP